HVRISVDFSYFILPPSNFLAQIEINLTFRGNGEAYEAEEAKSIKPLLQPMQLQSIQKADKKSKALAALVSCRHDGESLEMDCIQRLYSLSTTFQSIIQACSWKLTFSITACLVSNEKLGMSKRGSRGNMWWFSVSDVDLCLKFCFTLIVTTKPHTTLHLLEWMFFR
ncbi:hypothetical protein ILYODFUR_035410, partial [Ilyodon furcidens]